MKLQTTCVLLVAVNLAIAADILDLFKGDGSVSKKRLVVHRVGQCIGKKDLPIYFTDFRVTPYNRTNYVVNGEVIFHEDFPNGWEASASVKKCDDFKSSSSCRPFLNNVANSDVCGMLAATAAYSQYWSTLLPKAQCPFRKGSYVLTDQLEDDVATNFLPGAGNTHWEVQTTGRVGDRVVLCFIIQLISRPKKLKESSRQ